MKVADRATGGQHGARVRGHDGLLPHRRANARLSPRNRPHRRRSRSGRALHEGAAAFPHADARRRAPITPRCCGSTWARSSRAWPARSGRKTACRCGDVKAVVPPGACRPPVQAARLRARRRADRRATVAVERRRPTIGHGAVVIAAITSCTNTSNPARDAGRRAAGQKGGRARAAGQAAREDQPRPRQPRGDRLSATRPGWTSRWSSSGFHTVGYGCTTCIGNSGPLPRAGGQGRQRGQPGGGGRAERQPQLRGPHQSAGEGQLPGQPAAGRGLRPGRHDRYRPDHASRWASAATASRSI